MKLQFSNGRVVDVYLHHFHNHEFSLGQHLTFDSFDKSTEDKKNGTTRIRFIDENGTQWEAEAVCDSREKGFNKEKGRKEAGKKLVKLMGDNLTFDERVDLWHFLLPKRVAAQDYGNVNVVLGYMGELEETNNV